MSFRLESVVLGTDSEGNVTTAPVVVQVDTVTNDGSNLKGNAAKAFDSFKLALAEHGQLSPDGSHGFPDGLRVVPRETGGRSSSTPMPARKNRMQRKTR